jgi:hypothetical protein
MGSSVKINKIFVREKERKGSDKLNICRQRNKIRSRERKKNLVINRKYVDSVMTRFFQIYGECTSICHAIFRTDRLTL